MCQNESRDIASCHFVSFCEHKRVPQLGPFKGKGFAAFVSHLLRLYDLVRLFHSVRSFVHSFVLSFVSITQFVATLGFPSAFSFPAPSSPHSRIRSSILF